MPRSSSKAVRRPRRRLPIFADIALAAAILAALALVVARGLWEPPQMLAGNARVVDGDSIVIGGERVRLAGIDAPELAQTCMRDGTGYACGRDARMALECLVAGGEVSCRHHERDRYGRVLGYCAAGGVDLNREMVRSGWAIAYGDFDGAEREARQASRGIWAGAFDSPQEWRRQHGGLAEDAHRPAVSARMSAYVWGWFD